jgi:hypothetical protein
VIKLVTSGTIEEDILRLGEVKLRLDRQVSADDGTNNTEEADEEGDESGTDTSTAGMEGGKASTRTLSMLKKALLNSA